MQNDSLYYADSSDWCNEEQIQHSTRVFEKIKINANTVEAIKNVTLCFKSYAFSLGLTHFFVKLVKF